MYGWRLGATRRAPSVVAWKPHRSSISVSGGKGSRSLSGCTAAQWRASLPRQKRWTPQIAYALGLSLLKYLEEQGALASPPPTPSERLIHAYREHLKRVRGLAASTIARHARLAGDFLHFLQYDDDVHRLPQVGLVDLETFVAEARARVGRITLQKVIAIRRSFLRFLAVLGETPPGLDRPSTRRGTTAANHSSEPFPGTTRCPCCRPSIAPR